MLRSVHAFLPVAGHPDGLRAAFVADPGRWLPDARCTGSDRWTMTVRAGQLSRTVTARVSAPWRAGQTHWRSLSWDPTGEDVEPIPVERFLPTLDGELGLHLAPAGASLMLDSRYRPPGGAVGAALDSVALHRVARATLDRLLADVATRLGAQARLVVHSGGDGEPGGRTDDGAATRTHQLPREAG
jgi:hypothetical protein